MRPSPRPRKTPREPSNRAEWQEAADAAQWLLLVDSARKYGLITGGPTVNVERCESLLRKAAAIGVKPAATDVLCRRFVG